MTHLERAIEAKKIGTQLLELSEVVGPDNFRSIFFGLLTAVVHRLDERYWKAMLSTPVSNKWGPEVEVATDNLVKSMDAFRATLNKHAAQLNDIKDQISKENNTQRN